jgi:hypothetical protein
MGFAVYSLVWTALTFLLSGPPFRYPVTVIRLFGLAGLAVPSPSGPPVDCMTAVGRFRPPA